MELLFLGTNAGVPSLQRNVTAIALRLLEERRSFWLFDCGEATQHQILKSPLKLSKLEKIFITHLHGDHIFGLPGLLASRSNQGGKSPLTIYGPLGIKKFIETTMNLSQSRMDYVLDIVEHDGGMIFEDETFAVYSEMLEHRIQCYGYRVIEKDRNGSLNLPLLQSYGLKPGPDYGKIKRGESIVLENGQVIRPEDVLGAPKKGLIVTILGDTRPCPSVINLAKHADVLVHEATFLNEMVDTAYEYYHSTALQAATAGRQAEVKHLILTHFSSRYKDMEQLDKVLAEAQSVFPNTSLAEEFIIYPIERS
ncbi:ribonuclease Z [Paenibacillus crassostreae]|uniref:Ribonuclease Z n=1 Tax=Paenibacillus crassostreae TaxID=1763538 RepID=A0A167DS76_9BACL|nr:ribonuclease Z [Paenibacillus crassostreae]AOZ91119.1 ribonuclease Z [Paenibacillus crassostreae]OAB74721.1 ribonuclease Z [Paenibacillus crassostreae]